MSDQNSYLNKFLRPLQDYLSISTPSSSKNAPSIYEFERFRELEIDWHNITSQKTDGLDKIDDIKGYFKQSWKSSTTDDINRFEDDQPFYNLKYNLATPEQGYFWKVSTIFLNGEKSKSFENCICIIHKPSNRLYAFVNKNFVPATEEILGWIPTILVKDAWLSFENDFFFSLVQAYENSDDAGLFATTTTYIKREAVLFREEYERLKSQIKFIQTFNTYSDTYIENLFKTSETFKQFWNDEEELNKTANTYSNLATKKFSIEQKLRQLAAKVKEHGYYLALNAETVKVPDGNGGLKDLALTSGEIYQIKQDIYLRRDVVRRQEWQKIKDGKNSFWRRVWVEDPTWIPTGFENYVAVDLLTDPVQTAINKLKETNYLVYFGQRRNGGFYTEEDVPLIDILKRCETDETFRRKCVVVVPQYDYLISNKSYYLGAFIFKFPLPGIIPTSYPLVGIREELSYRLAWVGTELGQLVSTINLAPGETRTITVSSKFKQTTAQTASFKSINDVNTSDSFDLATEFQKEASQEFNRNDTFQASASGGYGVGPFSASASASGSRSTNLKTFSKEMSRVAKKTSQSINRKISQEITSSSAVTTEVSQETSKSILITNINKGSTLNLLFYQVNNKYKAATYLTNLEIQISSTKELIAGSGIYETYSFRTNELSTGVFEKLHPDILPGINPDQPATACPTPLEIPDLDISYEGEDEWCYYWRRLLHILTQTLDEEYANKNPNSAKVIRIEQSDVFDRIAKKIINANGGLAKIFKKDYISEMEGEFITAPNLMKILEGNLSVCDYFSLVNAALKNIEILDEQPVTEADILIASGGLYVDSMVGVIPATEAYSENMRHLETLRVEAEIEKMKVGNDEIRAKIDLLLTGEIFIKHIFILSDSDKKSVLLEFTKGISDVDKTHWEVYLEHLKVDNCEINITSPAPANTMSIIWPGEPPPKEFLEMNMFLRNNQTNLILRKF
jgi:hypothetical protein